VIIARLATIELIRRTSSASWLMSSPSGDTTRLLRRSTCSASRSATRYSHVVKRAPPSKPPMPRLTESRVCCSASSTSPSSSSSLRMGATASRWRSIICSRNDSAFPSPATASVTTGARASSIARKSPRARAPTIS
jgi:hypothetical protein